MRAQQIRYIEAKAIVEQAKAVEEVSLISLKEYEEGIYPQDVQLIRQYLTTCKLDAERAQKSYEWSKATNALGYRTAGQLLADALAVQQTTISLREAEGMGKRLENFTGPRIKKNLQARIAAIKADRLAQSATLQLETDRLRRLERMVANCTIRAPRDGLVVYATKSTPWGQVQDLIDEGVAVREGQPIIYLPDPKHMRVKAKINESKVSLVQPGLRARITIDAFPTRPLFGTVTEVTPIPAPTNGGMSDVKIYFATVNIDSEGFDELRPGLSAEVQFLVDSSRKVTRVPLQAVRYVDNATYAAVAESRSGTMARRNGLQQWRSVIIGQSDANFAEVISGLKPGDRVIARPDHLPAPKGATPKTDQPAESIAEAREQTRG